MKATTAVLLACIALLGLVQNVSAEEAYVQCMATPDADRRKCGDEWMLREQGVVDQKWTALIGLTDGAVADSLASEQTAWKEFKEASCAFMRDTAFAPGGDTSTYYACRAGVIADRVKEIDAYTSYIDN